MTACGPQCTSAPNKGTKPTIVKVSSQRWGWPPLLPATPMQDQCKLAASGPSLANISQQLIHKVVPRQTCESEGTAIPESSVAPMVTPIMRETITKLCICNHLHLWHEAMNKCNHLPICQAPGVGESGMPSMSERNLSVKASSAVARGLPLAETLSGASAPNSAACRFSICNWCNKVRRLPAFNKSPATRHAARTPGP